MVFPCCMTCAFRQTGEIQPIAAALVEECVVQAKLWIDGREYEAEKTLGDLIRQAENEDRFRTKRESDPPMKITDEDIPF